MTRHEEQEQCGRIKCHLVVMMESGREYMIQRGEDELVERGQRKVCSLRGCDDDDDEATAKRALK